MSDLSLGPGDEGPNVQLTVRILLVCALLLFPVYSISLAFAQEGQFQSLVSGMEYYRDGNYEKALEQFQKASVIFPDDPDIPFYMGLTYLQLNQPERAIAHFQKTLDMDPAYLDARFQLGLALIQQKAYQEAIPHLEEVYKKEPKRNDLGYFLGFAYYQTGEYRRALELLEAGRTGDKAIESLTLYYIGLAKQQLGLTQGAVQAYSQVRLLDPSSPLAVPSQRLAEAIELETKERLKKRFNFEITGKVQYDNNVILVPTTNVFELRDKKRKSWADLFFLKGEYFPVRTSNFDLSVSYGLFQTLYYNVKHNDVQDHIFSVDSLARVEFGIPVNFKLTYSYDLLLLDYSKFLQRHTVRPSAVFLWSPQSITLLQYTLQAKDFRERPVLTEDNRDAVNREGGLMHFVLFEGGRHYLRFGYFGEWESAKGSDWDYGAHKALAGFQYTFPLDVRLNLDYAYKTILYTHNNIFFPDEGRRRDIERTTTVALSKDVLKNLTIFLEYLNTRNSSNISLFDYRRNIISLGITWRY